MEMNTQINLTNSHKYVLSLDTLDLSLLHATYRERLNGDTALLWSKRKYHEDDYYEFEIHTKSGSGVFEFDENFAYTPTIETHAICYICNIPVPNNYWIKHINSSKHKSYQKIANTAFERIRKHKQGNIICKEKEVGLEYFCEHCVCIISLSDRGDHERSKKHKNFAALDNFLNNFASFYTNENGDESVPQTDDANINILCLKVNKRADGIGNINKDSNYEDKSIKDNVAANRNVTVDENKETSVLDEKLKEAKVLIGNIASCLDTSHKEVNNNVTEDGELEEANVVNNLKQYIRLLKRYGTIKLCTINSLNQDKIIIEALDGSEIMTSVNNFHGLKKSGKKYIQCQLCKIFVSNVNEHKVCEKHIKIVAQPIENKNCLRHVRDSWSHCVICNVVTDDIVNHVQFNVHVKKLTQSIVSNEHTKNKCEEVINNEEAKLALKHTDKEIDTLEQVATNTYVTVENNTLKSFDEATEAEDSKIILKGVNGTGNINEHQRYCSICDKWMHVNNFDTHLNGTKHILNSKTGYSYIMRKHKNGLTCKVCNCNVLNFFWAIEDHIASPKHVKNYLNLLADNNIVKNKDNFYCKPCTLDVLKTNEVIHIENQRHKIRLASYKINYIASIKLPKLTKDIDTFTTNTETKQEVSEELIDSKKIKVNDKKILANNVNSGNESHENIKNTNGCLHSKIEHTNDVTSTTSIRNESKMKIKQDSEDMQLYQCEACNEEFANNPNSIKVHNEGAQHKMMDVLISGVNNLLEELLKYFRNPPEIHYHFKRTDDENKLKCKLCNINISIEDTEKHTNSLKHIRNHRDFIEVNKLKLRNERYVCYACNVYVDIDKEFRHIQTQKHIQRIESLKKGDCILVTSDTKKLMDKINHDLKVFELEQGISKATDVKFGDFITLNKRVANIRSNVSSHFAKIIDDEKQIICVLCQELVHNTDKERHANDADHKMYYTEVMAHNQIFETDGGFVCGFCECLVNGNEFDHMLGEKHEGNVKRDPRKNFCFKCNISTIDTGVRDHLTSVEHIRNINDGTQSQYYCNTCNLQLTNSEANIRRHNDGFQHKNNCSLIEENTLLLKNKKCFCQVCEKSFSRDRLEDHINSSKHIMLCVQDE